MRPNGSEVERLLADNRLAHELLGWEPRVGLEDGLKRTIEWMRRDAAIYAPLAILRRVLWAERFFPTAEKRSLQRKMAATIINILATAV